MGEQHVALVAPQVGEQGWKRLARCATLGFRDQARLDGGDPWPSVTGLAAWNDEVERRVVDLLRRSLG